MKKVSLFSPAKLNLFFRVLRKRNDGYHDIASLIQCVNFGDILTFELTDDQKSSLTSNEPSLGFNADNLIYKAVELFKKNTDISFGVNITLHKRIPMQAGLGGGSSNAATTLYGLNKLVQTNIPDSILAHWGSSLGADVPCFFSLGRAFCEGIGEKITDMAHLDEEYTVAKPLNLSLSTPLVYQVYDMSYSSLHTPCDLLTSFQQRSPIFINDLERAAFSLIPELGDFKKRCLDLGFHSVMMTGSGTGFVCTGDIQDPILTGAFFKKVRSLNRTLGNWYSFFQ